jgi:hypothetical protein
MILKILHIKKTQIRALVLEVVVHVTRVVALVQAKLKKGKIANAQPRFFESSSKLMQTFVAPKSQTKERILERTKEEHARHNSGGVGRTTTTSLDDESSPSCNSNSKELG